MTRVRSGSRVPGVFAAAIILIGWAGGVACGECDVRKLSGDLYDAMSSGAEVYVCSVDGYRPLENLRRRTRGLMSLKVLRVLEGIPRDHVVVPYISPPAGPSIGGFEIEIWPLKEDPRCFVWVAASARWIS